MQLETGNHGQQVSQTNPLHTQLMGSNATDLAGTLSASFEKDLNGDGLLRIIDGSPLGYDEKTDTWANKVMEEITIISSVTILAGATYSQVVLSPVNAKSINFMITELNSVAAKVVLFLGSNDQEGTFYSQSTSLINLTTAAVSAISTNFTVITNNIKVFIQNTDTIDHTFKVKATKFYV